MTGHIHSGFRHDLQITTRRSSWPLVLAGVAVFFAAKVVGL